MCLWDLSDGRCIENTKMPIVHTSVQVYIYFSLSIGLIPTTICDIIRRLPLFVREIRLAMKFLQNVLHYKWHTSRVYVIHINFLSRYFLLTENWTNKAKWRSIEASNNVNKHTGHGLLAVELAPPNKVCFS